MSGRGSSRSRTVKRVVSVIKEKGEDITYKQGQCAYVGVEKVGEKQAGAHS